jgi:hypothetical protein
VENAMTDPTLATVDDEPWNRSPAEQRRLALEERKRQWAANAPIFQSPPVPIDKALSPGERVFRGLPVLAPDGSPAQFVYDLTGKTTLPERCYGCAATCMLTLWTELQRQTKHKRGKAYRVVRDVKLCNACSSALKRLPLGTQWTKRA